MGWRCVSVRRRLALFAGDDLSEHEKRSVEIHLNGCASCRDRLAALRGSRDVIQQYQAVPSDLDTLPSLWPRIRHQLTQQELSRRPGRSWLPVSAVAAATIAMGVVLWNRPAHLEPFPDRAPRSAIPTADSSDHEFNGVSIPRLQSEKMTSRSALEQGNSPGTPYFHLESARPVGLFPDEF